MTASHGTHPSRSVWPTGADDQRWAVVLFAGLALLLAWRIGALALNRTDLFFDEAQYWFWSTELAAGYYSKPPLIAWIIRASTEVCGLSEFCIRLPSALIHTATALVVAGIGSRLYDMRVGALSGLVFATLPGVSLSAGIISTDVPLLLAWAIALLAFAILVEDEARRWWPAVLLGVAAGVGLNAKYAMAWFVVCVAVYFLIAPHRRRILRDGRLVLALAIALLFLVPNMAWNASHDFATLSHTADNAKWGGSLLHPTKAVEFFLAQFGVFGPILFGALLVIAWRAFRQPLGEADRLLIAFALPIVAVITVQAFLSRAHANWAAVSYVAASVLVTATMARDGAWGWLKASLGLHAAIVALIAIGTTTAGTFKIPGGRDPFARTLGWAELAKLTAEKLSAAQAEGRPFAAVLSDDRATSSSFVYYLRDAPVPVYALTSGRRPRDHFELTRPFAGADGRPVLLVSLAKTFRSELFENIEELGTIDIEAGATETRQVRFYRLSGYRKTQTR